MSEQGAQRGIVKGNKLFRAKKYGGGGESHDHPRPERMFSFLDNITWYSLTVTRFFTNQAQIWHRVRRQNSFCK